MKCFQYFEMNESRSKINFENVTKTCIFWRDKHSFDCRAVLISLFFHSMEIVFFLVVYSVMEKYERQSFGPFKRRNLSVDFLIKI